MFNSLCISAGASVKRNFSRKRTGHCELCSVSTVRNPVTPSTILVSFEQLSEGGACGVKFSCKVFCKLLMHSPYAGLDHTRLTNPSSAKNHNAA